MPLRIGLDLDRHALLGLLVDARVDLPEGSASDVLDEVDLAGGGLGGGVHAALVLIPAGDGECLRGGVRPHVVMAAGVIVGRHEHHGQEGEAGGKLRVRVRVRMSQGVDAGQALALFVQVFNLSF